MSGYYYIIIIILDEGLRSQFPDPTALSPGRASKLTVKSVDVEVMTSQQTQEPLDLQPMTVDDEHSPA